MPGTANNRFHGPRHMAIYNNTLYVADSGNHRVQLFNVSNPMSPTYVAGVGVTGQSGSDNSHLGSPSGVTVDSLFIHVADTWNNRVQIFHHATQGYAATLGGTRGGQLPGLRAFGYSRGSTGELLRGRLREHRVQQFHGSRTYLRTYGTTGVPYLTDGYHYNSPSGVVATGDGSLYITENAGHPPDQAQHCRPTRMDGRRGPGSRATGTKPTTT